jgi:hypothetical protein
MWLQLIIGPYRSLVQRPAQIQDVNEKNNCKWQ